MVNTWPQVDNAIQWLNLYLAQSFLLTLIQQIVIYCMAGQRYPLLIYQHFATVVLNPLTPKSD